MNYHRPELSGRLAADYVLGLMPRRARQRFERVIAKDATLAATVTAWSDRFAPLDTMTANVAPPGHVWYAIDRRVGAGPRSTAQRRRVFAFVWRGLAVAAVAAGIALTVDAAIYPMPVRNVVQALAEKTGLPDWFATANRQAPTDIGLSTLRLGVPERERPRWLRAALLLSSDTVPLTQEPPPPSR
jgi:anti-sigma factor RsiW